MAALTNMVIEVAVFAVLIYLVLRFLRETRGSGVVRGLAFILIVGLGVFVVLIETMKLTRLALLFNSIAQSVVIALVIVFHPEIRRAIVHLGDSPIFGRFFQKESKIVQRVLRAVARMSKERIGALIAIEREASLQSLADSGITIDAELNSFLIETIFFPKTALHDGAIVVRDDRIVAASCLLPLSQNPDIDKRLGTRHRAALGLSEETDALAIVVSEETGKISVAQGGKLNFDLTLEQIERHLDESLGLRQRTARRTDRGRRALLPSIFHDPVRKLAAVALGIGLWFALDRMISDKVERSFQLRVIGLNEKPSQEIGINQLYLRLPTDRIALKEFFDLTASQSILGVTITLSGPKHSIEMLGPSLALPVVVSNVDWDKNESTEFSVAEIQTRVLPDDVTLTMEPSKVRFDGVRVAREAVPLREDQVELQVGSDAQLLGRVRTGATTFTRDTIHVAGPARDLDRFRDRQNERRFRAAISARAEDRQVSAEVKLLPEFEAMGLHLEESCSLTVQLTPEMTDYTLPVPVLVDDKALPAEEQGRYLPETPTKEIRVRVGGKLLAKLRSIDTPESSGLEAWARESLRLLVTVPPRDRGLPYPDEYTAVPQLELLGINRQFFAQDMEQPQDVSIRLLRRQ